MWKTGKLPPGKTKNTSIYFASESSVWEIDKGGRVNT